jgi:uncharacterized damage-inducible protein DinB
MDEELGRVLLAFSASKLEQLGERIVTCLGKLSDEQVWARGAENENAVGNLVLHLCGNVRQWIGSGMAGRPDARQRAGEFAARGSLPAAALAVRLTETISEAVSTLRAFPETRLLERVTIQGYDVTLLEVVCSVVEHFSHHAGQIIFITKHLTGEDLGFYRHLESAGEHIEKTP